MKHWQAVFFLWVILGFLNMSEVEAQLTYSGNVLDAIDKRYIEGVQISVLGQNVSSTTNSRGYFSTKASEGDTLLFRFEGFYDQKIRLEKDRFILVQLQDRARLLPSFEVKADPYLFRFINGKLTLIDEDELASQSTAKQSGLTKGTSTGAGVTINGPISYFTRRARNEREHIRKLKIIARRKGYLDVVDSDSVRSKIMDRHRLDRASWDKLIVRFNQSNLSHQFLDWSKDRVLSHLNLFIEREKALED